HGFCLTAPVFLFLFILKGLPSARRSSRVSTRPVRSWRPSSLSTSPAPPAPAEFDPCRAAAAGNLAFAAGSAESKTTSSPLTQTGVDPALPPTLAIPEEVLVVDPRASLTPAQFVDRKLMSLLKGNYRSFRSRPVYD